MKKVILYLFALCLVPNLAVGKNPTSQFGVRAMYVDCRTEVMTMDAIKALAADVASKGMNAILMEWEATFPFGKHATVCNLYSFTREEVKDLVSYCAGLGVDVIPLQNCFGHSEYILRHERYWDLREDIKDPSQVCPLKIEQAVPVFTEIFREVAELHPSQYFHIGADETYLLGDCPRCKAVAEKEGKSRLFVDYIKAMSQIVIDMGKTPIIWADIIVAYPEAVSELPKELVFVDWNYGWDPDRFGKLQNLFDAGLNMWGATALRSYPDNLFLTQWKKHFDNLAGFVPFSRQAGYTGMVQTSWSTGGTYGFHYDVPYEIINMQPIRSVYPQSAFNILIAATAHAFNTVEPLDPHAFVLEYARNVYGLGAVDGERLWNYFCMPQKLVRSRTGDDEDGVPVGRLVEECLAMKAEMDKVRPSSGRDEFAHYGLMLDMRINYLQYKEVESVYESKEYDRSMAAGLAARMKRILKEGEAIDKRFYQLNKGYLKEGELQYLLNARTEKMRSLYGWLEANK